MPHAYTEDQLVEQPAIGLFAEVGWATTTAAEDLSGTSVLGLILALWLEQMSLRHETKSEVVSPVRARQSRIQFAATK